MMRSMLPKLSTLSFLYFLDKQLPWYEYVPMAITLFRDALISFQRAYKVSYPALTESAGIAMNIANIVQTVRTAAFVYEGNPDFRYKLVWSTFMIPVVYVCFRSEQSPKSEKPTEDDNDPEKPLAEFIVRIAMNYLFAGMHS